MAPRGNPAGLVRVVEYITYRPYTQAKLADLMNQFHQQPRELLTVWLLRLWDLEVGSIVCNATEMEKLASITTYPSLRQRLQNSQRQGEGQGSHSLMEMVIGAILTVWANVGGVSDTGASGSPLQT